MIKLDWEKARKPKPTEPTRKVRFLEYRADKYLEAVEKNAKAKGKKK